MLIAQLFLVVSISVATAHVIVDSEVQNPSAALEVNCGRKICKNGATCKTGNICDCKPGTKGDECEVVIGCDKLKAKCDEISTECIYNTYLETATCKCTDEKKKFNGSSCEDCECGEFVTSCEFTSEGKYCFCKKNYSDKNGMCVPCTCGAPDFEDRCDYIDGKKSCLCKDGYSEKDGVCTECNCGAQMKSCGFITGDKFCLCNEGYQFKLGTCAVCNCGENSTNCYFEEGTANKSCTCKEGNADKLGTCTHCDCGPDTTCSYTSSGEKKCECIGKACEEPARYCDSSMTSCNTSCKCECTPWSKNPVVIVCIVALVGIVVFIGGFVAYRKLRRN